jgi:hypothetical protein
VALIDNHSQTIGNYFGLSCSPREDPMPRQEIVDASSKHRLPVANENKVVRNSLELSDDVRGKDDRHTVFSAVAHEFTEEVSSGDWVKTREWLVED